MMNFSIRPCTPRRLLSRLCRLLSAASFCTLAASAVAAAEIGVTNEEILVGQSAAMAGPAAELGTEMRVGAQLYFASVNRNGGLFKRDIKLITLDDGYNPDRTVANTKKLIEQDKVFALFGYVGTPTTAAALPLVTQARIPLFAPVTGAHSLREPVQAHVFFTRASEIDEAEKIVEQLVSTANRRIAVFYEDNDFGRTGLRAVNVALAKRGLTTVSSGAVQRNSADVKLALSSILPAKPDAIVLLSAYKSSAEFVRQAKKKSYRGRFFNVSFVGSTALATELGREGLGIAISQVVPFPWSAGVPIVREYQAQMNAYSNSPISFSSLEGFIAAKVFVEALRRAGKDPTREKFMAALESMSIYDVGGFVFRFSPENHSGSRYVDLTIIGSSGKFMK